MPWLIDAANLGGALGGAAGARNTKAILAALLPWARERPQVVVVFDGPEPTNFARQLGGVEIVWSGTRSADEVIAKRLAAIAASAGKAGSSKGAKASTVITNDQTLARRCRDLGAKVEPASVFALRTTQPKPKSRAARSAQAAADKPAPNASDIAHWRAVFGGKEKDL